MSTPPFSLTTPRYPQGTYWGRAMSFWDQSDPRMILVGDEELKASVALLEAFAAGTAAPGTTDEALWRARRVKEAIIHPDTGEKVPLLFRMSFFAPANVPTVAGMILGSSTIVRQVFWQWMNQSYNAGFNWCNRNATVETATSQLLQSYGFATSVAVTTVMGLNWATKALARGGRLSPGVMSLLTMGVPYFAVAAAGACNSTAMRWREAQGGIDVMDESGNSHGKSVVAGETALLQVALTRVILPAPIILFPPLVIWGLKAIGPIKRLCARSKAATVAIEIGTITVALIAFLPLAIATFPQTASIDASKLEPQFRGATNPTTGRPVQTYTFNKGV